MKLNFFKLTLCAAFVAGSGASASTLQRADVMANPAWLAHVDCDAVRPTSLGQYVLSIMDNPEAKAKLTAFASIFNFDLRTQLHGLTLYGGSQAPEDGILIVYADFDSNRLVTLAMAAPGYQSSEHNQHPIHSWIDESKRKHGGKARVFAAIDGNRVIFGQREDPLGEALDVIDGKDPNMAGTKSFPDLGLPGNSHLLEAAARKMDIPDGAPDAAILRLCKSGELIIGQSQKEFQAALTLATDSDDTANQIYSVAQGLMALWKLQHKDPAAAKFANAIVFTQDGSSVRANLALPIDVVVDAMKANAARKAAAKEARELKEQDSQH